MGIIRTVLSNVKGGECPRKGLEGPFLWLKSVMFFDSLKLQVYQTALGISCSMSDSSCILLTPIRAVP